MRFPRWIYWLLVGLAVALAFAAHSYYVDHCHCHCYGQKEYSERWGWMCKLVGEPSAFFTAIGAIGVVVGYLLLSGQIARAEAANEIAVGALSVVHNAERGILTIVKLSPFEGIGGAQFLYELRNIGRSAVVILEVRSSSAKAFYKKQDTAERPTKDSEPIWESVVSGETIGSASSALPHIESAVDMDADEWDGKPVMYLVSPVSIYLVVKYRTVFDEVFEYDCRLYFFNVPDEVTGEPFGAWRVVWSGTRCVERPAPQQGA